MAVVPDYTDARPANYATLISSFIRHATAPRCLDHGGGNGRLTALLREGGVYGSSWDPMDGRRLAVWLIRSRHCLRGAGAHTRTSDDHGAGARITHPVRRDAVFDVVDRSFATACNGPLVHRPRNGHVTIFTTQTLQMLFGTSGIGCITLIGIFIWRSRRRRTGSRSRREWKAGLVNVGQPALNCRLPDRQPQATSFSANAGSAMRPSGLTLNHAAYSAGRNTSVSTVPTIVPPIRV